MKSMERRLRRLEEIRLSKEPQVYIVDTEEAALELEKELGPGDVVFIDDIDDDPIDNEREDAVDGQTDG